MVCGSWQPPRDWAAQVPARVSIQTVGKGAHEYNQPGGGISLLHALSRGMVGPPQILDLHTNNPSMKGAGGLLPGLPSLAHAFFGLKLPIS